MRKLVINAALCDIRNITAATVGKYDKIEIRAATILNSGDAMELLKDVKLELSCANSVALDRDVKASTINGIHRIYRGTSSDELIFLMVNGQLIIESGTEEIIKSYKGIHVNGEVFMPKSMNGLGGLMTVNGSFQLYPDNAIFIDGKIDKIFSLRSKNDDIYYSMEDIDLTKTDIDILNKLKEKNVSIETSQKVYLYESQLESCADVFTRETKMEIIPEGFVLVKAEDCLSVNLISGKGRKIYVVGDLDINDDNTLNQVDELTVTGTVYTRPEIASLLNRFNINKLVIVTNKVIKDVPKVTIELETLESNPLGVTVYDCAIVTLDKNISPQMIRNLLTIRDCAIVNCTSEQKAAVSEIATDIAKISTGFFKPKNLETVEEISGAVVTL